ncbi:hypothetical protein MIR68_012254 [Amoeboaphelidium protococcarum]|nr:hypothetical protein MIR68_012254 [Amoeboaphelidium protococcarum]
MVLSEQDLEELNHKLSKYNKKQLQLIGKRVGDCDTEAAKSDLQNQIVNDGFNCDKLLFAGLDFNFKNQVDQFNASLGRYLCRLYKLDVEDAQWVSFECLAAALLADWSTYTWKRFKDSPDFKEFYSPEKFRDVSILLIVANSLSFGFVEYPEFLKWLAFRMSLAAAVVSRGQQQSSQAQSTASVEIVHQRQINKAQLQIPLVPSYGKLITEDFFMRFSIQLPQSVSEGDAEFMSLVSTDVTADQTDRRLVVRLGGIHYVI